MSNLFKEFRNDYRSFLTFSLYEKNKRVDFNHNEISFTI